VEGMTQVEAVQEIDALLEKGRESIKAPKV